ncbi:16865_t:CDS:2 [Funneliformis geosporum]|nr:16865_t:CDS:2 [Funneliformis geosporum]
MKASKGIKVIFLPSYTPELNPIEKINHIIKDHVRKEKVKNKEKLRSVIKEKVKFFQKEDLNTYLDNSVNECLMKLNSTAQFEGNTLIWKLIKMTTTEHSNQGMQTLKIYQEHLYYKECGSLEEKKKVLWDIFVKLEKASLGCGELDLPFFGEILLKKCEEITPILAPNNIILKELKERAEKIKKCEPDPDYNIYLAKHICKKLIQEAN